MSNDIRRAMLACPSQHRKGNAEKPKSSRQLYEAVRQVTRLLQHPLNHPKRLRHRRNVVEFERAAHTQQRIEVARAHHVSDVLFVLLSQCRGHQIDADLRGGHRHGDRNIGATIDCPRAIRPTRSVGLQVQASMALERRTNVAPVQSSLHGDIAQCEHHAFFHAFQATNIEIAVGIGQ